MRKNVSKPLSPNEQPPRLTPDARPSTQDVAADDLDLESLFEQQRAWPELADYLLTRADEAAKPEERSHCLDKATRVFEQRLGDLQGALMSCVEAVKSAPTLDRITDLERLAAALSKDDVLPEVYDAAGIAAGRTELGAILLQRRIKITPPGRQHTNVALQLSSTLQELGRLNEASTVVEGALKLAPAAEALFEELSQLYGAQGCWHQFIENCWHHAAVTQDGHVRARLAFEAGRALQNRLGRADAAQAAYTEALTHEPHHLNARRGLVGVYRTRGDVESLAEALWELADLSDDRDERFACFTEAAAILRETLHDVERAKTIEARLLSIDTARASGHELACAAQASFRLGNLSEALAGFANADALAAPGVAWRVVWVTALTQSGQHHQQAATLARQLLADPALSASEQCELHTCVAKACLALGNPGAACNALTAALRAVPDHLPAISTLAQAHRNAGRFADAVAWKWTTFDRTSDEAEKVSHALEIVRWVRDEPNDASAERIVLEHALLHCPNSLPLLRELAAAYEQVGTSALPRAVQIYIEQAFNSNDVPTLTNALRALQRIFARTGDLGRSLNVSTGLVLLGQATEAEHDLVRRAAVAPFVPPEVSLRSSAWTKYIYHPSLDRNILAVVAHARDALAAIHARTATEWGLAFNWDQRPSLELEGHPFVQRLCHLAASLGIELPPLAFRNDFDGIADLIAIRTANSVKLALVLGNAFFEHRTEASFAFVMARIITRLRPEFFVTWPNICSGEVELGTVMASTMHFADHQDEMTAGFLKAASLTVNRAGLLMCRNLVSAVAEATTNLPFGIRLGQFEATRDLLAWSSTAEYALFERHLGSPA